MHRQVVLDTETTGLSPAQGHRVIEIGCIELIDRRRTGETFHFYLQPERQIDPGAERVHGITDAFLADKPLFAEVAEDLLEFLKEAELVIHNAPFDVGFLDHEFQLWSKARQQAPVSIEQLCTVLDTLVMARRKHAGQRNSLDALCKRYQVDASQRTVHGALMDAELLADVYLAMTGGQTSMFAAWQATPSADVRQAQGQDPAANSPAVATLDAHWAALEHCTSPLSEAELAAHQAFIDNMRAAGGGACLWDEQT